MTHIASHTTAEDFVLLKDHDFNFFVPLDGQLRQMVRCRAKYN